MSILDRNQSIARLDAEPGKCWDLVIIGGGASGLGVALEAAARGYSALLLEAHDFAKGTSSRSTKLVHGGVRYLAQGNIGLVMDALRERGRLLANAPHVTRKQPFVVPVYRWWDAAFYGAGLMVYDLLAGRLGLGRSRLLSRAEVLRRAPTVKQAGLKAGILYYDGQFDDARLALTLGLSAAEAGAVLVNHAPVTGLLKQDGKVTGVRFVDSETGIERTANARAIINATGLFTDQTRHLDDPSRPSTLSLSQGIHLVLDRSFLPGDDAVMVPKTADGRVLFAVPWHDRTIIGTTDTPIPEIALEPRPLEQEIEFLLTHAALYLEKAPARADVLAVFSGIRPLVKADGVSGTSAVPRDHLIITDPSGLITLTGGKWTTYRKMAEQTVDRAADLAGLPPVPSNTADRHLAGWVEKAGDYADPLTVYGADAGAIRALMASDPALVAPLHPRLPYPTALVIHAVRAEMARTVEDVLARRTRALLLDAAAALESAPKVAALMAAELGRDETWQRQQVEAFAATAAAHHL